MPDKNGSVLFPGLLQNLTDQSGRISFPVEMRAGLLHSHGIQLGELPDIFDHMRTDIFLLLTACLLKQRIQYMPGNTRTRLFVSDLPEGVRCF